MSKDLKKIQEKHLVTPFNAKAMALFPEKIKGKIWAILTVHTDRPPSKISLISFNKEEEIWSEDYWKKWYQNFKKYTLPLQRRPGDHIEVGTPPIKTKDGWLLFYSYIKDYSFPYRLFTVEAVLLDLKDPSKIVSKTRYPILAPEEHYEEVGEVPNILSPSGAIIKKRLVYLYYGAADTTCCLAFVKLPSFTKRLLKKKDKPVMLKRAKENPIITPIKENSWEAQATFNPAAIYLQGKVHLLYRAFSRKNTSVLGYAQSRDGFYIDYRSPEPVYLPREPFEQKLEPGSFSGCEDPRLTQIGNKIYMCYTAYDGKNSTRVALTWIRTKDFLSQKWDWAKPILISPPGPDDKNAAILPEKVNGKYLIFHRIGKSINISFHQDLNFNGESLKEYHWLGPRKGSWDGIKVGICAPPIKHKKG